MRQITNRKRRNIWNLHTQQSICFYKISNGKIHVKNLSKYLTVNYIHYLYMHMCIYTYKMYICFLLETLAAMPKFTAAATSTGAIESFITQKRSKVSSKPHGWTSLKVKYSRVPQKRGRTNFPSFWNLPSSCTCITQVAPCQWSNFTAFY